VSAGKRKRKRVRHFLFNHVLPPFVTAGFKLIGWTWRFHDPRRELQDKAIATGKPVVVAFFHSRTMQLLRYYSRPGGGKWVVMCSQSRDGDLMSQVEAGLGFKVARGSSGGGGSRALVSMIKTVREDPTYSSCLAVDGSRGPRGIAQLGIITLAQKTGSWLVPVVASTPHSFIYRWSWDRMALPLPFAKITVLQAEPMEIPAKPEADELEAIRAQLESTLLDLTREADTLSGFQDSEPLQALPKA
jgi:lysophospholipid acyltransferase (LPLAT)-like uncharacterized protein